MRHLFTGRLVQSAAAVILFVVTSPAATHSVWLYAGGNDLWSNAGNWPAAQHLELRTRY